MIQYLRNIIQDSDTPQGRAFDVIIILLIIISIITFTIETLPNLSQFQKTLLHYTEIVITLIFTIEYFLRIATSSNKKNYVFSFYGVIDLIAIAPFYLSLGIDLRSIRVFRLIRIFRILKLTRYSRAISRFGKALRLAKEEAVLFLFITLILLYLSAVGIYYFEHAVQPENFKSIPHCLWWAVATLTTVGYGDVYPITAGGKIFTFIMLMIGLGVVAVPAGLVASALARVNENDD